MSNHLSTLVISVKDNASAALTAINQKLHTLTGSPHVITVGAKVNTTAMNAIDQRLKSFKPAPVTVPFTTKAIGAAGTGLSAVAAGISEFAVPVAAAGLAVEKVVNKIAGFAEQWVGTFEKMGVAVSNFAAVTGSSTEDASKFIRVAQDLGLPAESLEQKILRMNKAARSTPAAFSGIGAAIEHNADGSLNSVGTFQNVITAMSTIGDAGKRAVAGTKLFGREWASLDAIIAQGGGDIAARLDAVSKSAIFDDEKANKAKALRDSFAHMRDSVQDLGLEFAENMAPAISEVTDELADVAKEATPMAEAFGSAVATMLQDLEPLIEGLALVAEGVKTAAKSDIAPGVPLSLGKVGGVVTSGWLLPGIQELKLLGLVADQFKDKKLDATFSEAAKATADAATEAGNYNEVLDHVVATADPFSALPDQWKALFKAIRSGNLETSEARLAIEALAAVLGVTSDKVIELGNAHLEDLAKDWAKGALDGLKSLEKLPEALEAWNIKAQDAQATLAGLGNEFTSMARRGQAMEDALSLNEAPITAIDNITKIHDSFRDLAKFIRDPKDKDGLGGKIPNIFNPNDVNAGPFLDKIASLRGQIGKAVADSFASGGEDKARLTAENFLNELYGTLKGKISKGDLATLLGINDFTAVIKVALDNESKAQTTAEIEALTGLQGGETPFTATIKLAVAKGTLSQQAAQILIEQELGRLGIPIPTSLKKPSAESTTKAQQEAQAFVTANAASLTTQMPSNLGAVPPAAATKAHDDAQGVINALTPLNWPTALATPKFVVPGHDSGGTAGGRGGIVAERRPEIINDRYLVTEPSWVPPGTRVTSGARTARILRSRGSRGLRHYDSGGVVPGATTININSAVVGNRYDVMRAVTKAQRDSVRLRGRRA